MGHPQSLEVERVSCGPPAQIHSYHPSFPRLLIFSLFKVPTCQTFPSYICAGQYQFLLYNSDGGNYGVDKSTKFFYHARISFWVKDIFVFHFLLQLRLFSVSANFSGRRAREMTLLMSRRRRKSIFFHFLEETENGVSKCWQQELSIAIRMGCTDPSKYLSHCLLVSNENAREDFIWNIANSPGISHRTLKPRARVRWSPHRSLSMSYSISLFSLGRPLYLPLGFSLKSITYMKLRDSHQYV